MKRKRLYRTIRERNPDGTPGKVVERISARCIYGEIQDAVRDSTSNPQQGLWGLHLAYDYTSIMRWIARNWACTRRDLEAAYPKCRHIYELAVQDHYLEEALRFGHEAYELAQALEIEKAEGAIAKAAAKYKEYNIDGTRRIIRT